MLTVQVTLHLLLSIHPTYRATTSPFSYLPSEWSSPSSAGTLGDGSILPPAATVPKLTGKRPDLEDLREDGLEGRRKANAVFVVLGEFCGSGERHEREEGMDADNLSEKWGLMGILGIDEADGRSL